MTTPAPTSKLSIFDPPQASGRAPRIETAIINYEYKGQTYAWRISCTAGETEEDLRVHLNKWIPGAVFKSVEIISETRNKD